MFTISIVTFNNELIIGKTLDSLMTHLPRNTPVKVCVVDNQSSDNTASIVSEYASRFDNIKFLRNDCNAGFGTAHNLAIRTAESDYHVIYNPDIFLTEDVFTPLGEFLRANPEIGMVCPRFTYHDGSLQHINHRYPSVLDLFLRKFLPDSLRIFFRVRLERYEMIDTGYDELCDVPFVSGAFMFCRTKILKEVCGFDERYFLYFEDADLSRKFQEQGFRTVYYPDVSVIHGWERAAHKNWRMAHVLVVNAIRYFNKWGYKLF